MKTENASLCDVFTNVGPALCRSKNEFGREPCNLIGLEAFYMTIYCAPIGPNSIWKYCKVLPLVILICAEQS